MWRLVVNFLVISVALAVAGFSNLALSLCVPHTKVAFNDLIPVDRAVDEVQLNADFFLGQARPATGSLRRDVEEAAGGVAKDDFSR